MLSFLVCYGIILSSLLGNTSHGLALRPHPTQNTRPWLGEHSTSHNSNIMHVHSYLPGKPILRKTSQILCDFPVNR